MLKIEKAKITTSKGKLARLLITCLAFAVIGLYMIIIPKTDSVFHLFSNRIFVVIMGSLCVLFFGFGFIFFLLQLFGYKYKHRGLKIDETGITDNSNSNAVGHIPWKDIQEVKINTLLKRKFLTIIVYNPYDYINRQKILSKRKGMEADLKQTGSPINISTGTLNSSVEKLKDKMEIKLNEFREKATSNTPYI